MNDETIRQALNIVREKQLHKKTWTLLWQGSLIGVVILLLAASGVWGWYTFTWEHNQRWEEAVRHWHRPKMMIERWIRFRWIHPDALYWIVRVRFDRGPIVLEGTPTDALYWSFTHYAGTEVNASVSSESVVLEPDGSYRIHFSKEKTGKNWIPVKDGSKRGVIYFRIYEPAALFPSRMPRVSQNGEIVVQRGEY